MSAMGHFRAIQSSFAISGYPPEADIGTAGIYDGVDAPRRHRCAKVEVLSTT
jgi:hypothetical protein